MGVLIRPATVADAAAITRVQVEGWRTAYRGLIPDSVLDAMSTDDPERVARRRSLLEQRDATDVVAELDGEVVGWVVIGPTRDAEPLAQQEVYACYVLPSAWGRGVGGALLEVALPVEAVSLWVLEGNARAIRFYESHGFRADGARKDYDADGTAVPEIRLTRPAE